MTHFDPMPVPDEQTHAPATMPTFAEFAMGAWVVDKQPVLAPSTMRGWLSRLYQCVLPVFGEWPVNRIRRQDIQQFLMMFDSPKQAKVSREVLCSVLGHACQKTDYGVLLDANPASGKFRYPVAAGPKQRPLGHILTSWDEIMSFIESVARLSPYSNYLKACITSLLDGLRPSESFGLDSPDIRLRAMKLHLSQGYTAGLKGFVLGPLKTNTAYSDMPILPEFKEDFTRLKPEAGPWLAKADGKRANPHTTSRHFKEFKDRHGLPNVTFQTMRHSFATACIRSGMDTLNVQAMMRHATYEMTLHYIHAPYLSLETKKNELIKSANSRVSAKPYDSLDEDLKKLILALVNDKPIPGGVGFGNESPNGPLNVPQNTPQENSCAGFSRSAKRVLTLLREDCYLTKSEMARRLDCSDNTVKAAIRELKAAEALTFVGHSKSGHWQLAA